VPGWRTAGVSRTAGSAILPASLGGSLTSHRVICKGCNDWLGATTDKKLFDGDCKVVLRCGEA